MKKAIILLTVATIIFSCTKKAGPVITRRTNEPPAPYTTVNVKADLVKGESVFTNRCGRCHGLPETSKYSAARWEGIMNAMAPRARLSKEEEVHVRAYVAAHAAK